MRSDEGMAGNDDGGREASVVSNDDDAGTVKGKTRKGKKAYLAVWGRWTA